MSTVSNDTFSTCVGDTVCHVGTTDVLFIRGLLGTYGSLSLSLSLSFLFFRWVGMGSAFGTIETKETHRTLLVASTPHDPSFPSIPP